eukprot:TRINITY_DN2841_c0_g1_i8.p1 TRINITY_DN2841_c0_g1~~TRINITY_DN2841_c0_g1_i8.p1  ORF type:complete len:684 (+),score=240.26 TRINITY_DN2841_c0_g1_i8:14-2065(+)
MSTTEGADAREEGTENTPKASNRPNKKNSSTHNPKMSGKQSTMTIRDTFRKMFATNSNGKKEDLVIVRNDDVKNENDSEISDDNSSGTGAISESDENTKKTVLKWTRSDTNVVSPEEKIEISSSKSLPSSPQGSIKTNNEAKGLKGGEKGPPKSEKFYDLGRERSNSIGSPSDEGGKHVKDAASSSSIDLTLHMKDNENNSKLNGNFGRVPPPRRMTDLNLNRPSAPSSPKPSPPSPFTPRPSTPTPPNSPAIKASGRELPSVPKKTPPPVIPEKPTSLLSPKNAEREAEKAALEKEQKRLKRRKDIFDEIISTEVSYTDALHKANFEFYVPLRNLIQQNPKEFSIDGKPMTNEHVATIFSNLPMIMGFNDQLLKELKSRGESWTQETLVGDVFLRLTPFLKLYTEYSGNFNQSIEILGKTCSSFGEWLESRKRESGSQPLDSLLIAPIQRIPRYNLLLKELIQHTKEDHADHSNLTASLALMSQVAEHVNNSTKTADNLKKMVMIDNMVQKSEGMDIVVPHRLFLKEDSTVVLIKNLKNGTQKRETVTLILFSDAILIAQPRLVGKMVIVALMSLYETMIMDVPESATATFLFTLQSTNRSYTLGANRLTEKKDWLNAMNEARDKTMEIEGARMIFKVLKKKEEEQMRLKAQAISQASNVANSESNPLSNSKGSVDSNKDPH